MSDVNIAVTHSDVGITVTREDVLYPVTLNVVGTVAGDGGSGVADGNKGDITVSGSGATWRVNSRAITAAKFAEIGASKLIGRHTGTAGDFQEIGIDGGLEFQGGNLRRSALTGDVTASAGSNTLTLAQKGATTGQVQTWDGSEWSPATPSGGASGIDSTLEIAKAFSGINYKAVYFPQGPYGTALSMVDGQVFFQAVWVPENCTVTGVSFAARTNGNYTGDNYNGAGLYTWDATTQTLTLVASTTNAADFWSTLSTNQWNQKAFSSPYSATAGLYFIALLYNNSAQTTAPQLPSFTWGTGSNSILSAGIPLLNTFRAGVNMIATGQTALPSTTNTNTAFANSSPFIAALY